MEFKLGNSYTYKSDGTYTTGLIDTFTVTANEATVVAYTYTYDNNGNITRITTSNGYEYRYVYDDLGQLIREDNSDDEKTYLYTYDNAGNILTKQICAYTAAGVTPTPTTTYTYTYGNSNWGDQLTAYRGVSLEYDAIGNPVTYYNGKSYVFTWTQGRRLASAVVGSYNLAYNYNSDGIRTSKTVNGVEYRYTLDGTKILTQEWGNEMLVFLYDEAGSPVGFQYRNSSYAYDQFDTYWYRKNLQGDVMAIYDADGTTIAWYAYDAFGKQTYGAWRTHASNLYKNIYNLNPYRYRSYYYDTETSLYYLNSRYYDPATCRFINADGFISTGQGILGNNMYAYCGNNPIMRVDDDGEFWHIIAGTITGAVIGAITSIIEQASSGDGINCGLVGVSAAAGALSGALATVGLSPVANLAVQTIGNAVISAGESMASQAIENDGGNIDYRQVAFDAVIGGVTSIGNGLSRGASKHLMTQGLEATKQISKKGFRIAAKYYFSQTSTLFYEPLIKDAMSELHRVATRAICNMFTIPVQ